MTTIQLELPALSGAILAGGASRRMGVDKALLMLAGKTLLERAIASVGRVTSDLMIVGDREPYRRFGVSVVADAFPGTGALGGIATALRHASNEYVLVVACDMPFLSESLLGAMANLPRDFDALIPVTGATRSGQGGSRTYETLHAIYRRTCLGQFERQLARHELKVVEALTGLQVRELPECWLRRFDPQLDSLMNANHPDEWVAAIRRFEGQTSIVEDRT